MKTRRVSQPPGPSLEADLDYSAELKKLRAIEAALEPLRNEERGLVGRIQETKDVSLAEELGDDLTQLRRRIARAERARSAQAMEADAAKALAIQRVITEAGEDEQALAKRLAVALVELLFAQDAALAYNEMLRGCGVPHSLPGFGSIAPAMLLSIVVHLVHAGTLPIADLPPAVLKAIRNNPVAAGSAMGTGETLRQLGAT